MSPTCPTHPTRQTGRYRKGVPVPPSRSGNPQQWAGGTLIRSPTHFRSSTRVSEWSEGEGGDPRWRRSAQGRAARPRSCYPARDSRTPAGPALPGGEWQNQRGDRQDDTGEGTSETRTVVKWPPPPNSPPHTDPEEPRWEWVVVRRGRA